MLSPHSGISSRSVIDVYSRRRRSFPGKAEGVAVAGATSAAAPAKAAAPPPAAKKAQMCSDDVRTHHR